MNTDYKTIDLFGHPVFSWATHEAPDRVVLSLPKNEARLSYVQAGELSVYSATDEVHISTREAILTKCGTHVRRMRSGKEDGTFSSVCIHLHKEVLEKIYETNGLPLPSPKTDDPLLHLAKMEARPLLRQFFTGVVYYFHNPHLITEDILILKLKEIFLFLLNMEEGSPVLDLLPRLFEKQAFSFEEVVEQHVYSTINIPDLAQLTHLDLASFRKQFAQIYQQAPSSYIMGKRAEKVAERLLGSEDTIRQIAIECGFKNPSHLGRIFKPIYGCSPSEYRMTVLKQ